SACGAPWVAREPFSWDHSAPAARRCGADGTQTAIVMPPRSTPSGRAVPATTRRQGSTCEIRPTAGAPRMSDFSRTRRHFLGTVIAAGIGSAARRIGAQAPGAEVVDIHQHFVSPQFLATLTARNAQVTVPGLAAWKGYSPAAAVEAM